MSIALWVKVEALEQRIAALESLGRDREKPDHLLAVNRERQARGDGLHEAICQIVAANPGWQASQVLAQLASNGIKREKLPSIRTVQWHMKSARNTPVLRKV